MSFEYMTKEGCGSGVFLFRPLLALAALWSSTQMQLRRCLKCGWGIVPEILHLSLPLLSLPMFCCFNVSSGIWFAFLSSVLSGLPSLPSTTQPEAVVTFGLVFAVSLHARRNKMRWTTTRSPMMGCSGGLK